MSTVLACLPLMMTGGLLYGPGLPPPPSGTAGFMQQPQKINPPKPLALFFNELRYWPITSP